jgi:trk system potassium uptake protein
MNYYLISRLLGILIMFLGAFQSLSIIVAVIYDESQSIYAYAFSTVLVEVIGFWLYVFGKKNDDETLYRREAIATVALSWLAIGILGALPYVIEGGIPNYIDAFFETVSGFTTTGSTILVDIESLSKTSLFWRSFTQWLGGMGIIVLFIAIFPQLGVGAKHLFKSEVPGPITEGLRPKIKETSSALWRIYLGLTLLLMLILYACGMPLFDSICHALTTMATGGFSIKNSSIKFYDSAVIDYVISLFMLLAGVNFSLYYLTFKGRILQAKRDIEFKLYIKIIVVFSILIAYDILARYDYSVFDAIRYSVFQVVSIITTTGFATDDFNVYPVFSKFMLIAIMFSGGCAGSTAGGIKISRIYIAFRASVLEVFKSFKPQYIKHLKINTNVVNIDLIRGVFAFIFIFMITLILGSVFISIFGIDMETSLTSVLTALSNVGPGLGRVGAIENFSFFPAIVKIFLSFCMILGRLEFFTLLVFLLPSFWKR